MKDPDKFDGIYFFCKKPVDMRKSFSGLSHIVQAEMKRNFFASSLFVFMNRNRTMVKCLYWRRTGIAVWGFRLEKDRFKSLSCGNHVDREITADQFRMLLDGCNLDAMQPHPSLHFEATS